MKKLPYVDNVGNAMAGTKNRSKLYWRLSKLWNMAQTGSRTKQQWGRGPYPTTTPRNEKGNQVEE